MKCISYSYLLLSMIMFFSISCKVQLVKTTGDAKILMQKKEQFIGKPFKNLLAEIKPEIKYAYGSPEDKGHSLTGATIKFFFVDRERLIASNSKLTGVLVSFMNNENNKHKPLPKGNVLITKKMLLQDYGDMIVKSVYVTGEN